jgi:hypothetical protein
MDTVHPHSGASYSVVSLDNMTFGVRVTIPDSSPTTVTSFASAADAESWIERHKQAVASGDSVRKRPSYGSRRSPVGS